MTGLGEGERYVSISADGSTLATLNLEGTVRIWDVPTGGEPAHTHSGLTADPMSMLVSADGAHVAVTDLAGMLYLLSDGGTETVEAHTGSAYLAHFSPADDLVATHGEDMEIRMWDPETGAEEVTLTGHTGPVRDTSFSGDGTLLASSAGDGTARWWDLDEPGEIGMAEFEGEGPYAVAASSDDRLVGVVDEPEGSPVLETGSGETIAELDSLDGFSSLRFCTDDRTMVSVSMASGRLWDSHLGDTVGTLIGGADGVPGTDSADGLMPALNRDCTLFVWIDGEPGDGSVVANSVVPA